MDACHHYGQKQEGACQLHDPHKTEQEILAGNERERDGFFFLLCPSQLSCAKRRRLKLQSAEELCGMHIK